MYYVNYFIYWKLILQLNFSDQAKSKKQLKKEEKLAAKAIKKEQFKTNVSVYSYHILLFILHFLNI